MFDEEAQANDEEQMMLGQPLYIRQNTTHITNEVFLNGIITEGRVEALLNSKCTWENNLVTDFVVASIMNRLRCEEETTHVCVPFVVNYNPLEHETFWEKYIEEGLSADKKLCGVGLVPAHYFAFEIDPQTNVIKIFNETNKGWEDLKKLAIQCIFESMHWCWIKVDGNSGIQKKKPKNDGFENVWKIEKADSHLRTEDDSQTLCGPIAFMEVFKMLHGHFPIELEGVHTDGVDEDGDFLVRLRCLQWFVLATNIMIEHDEIGFLEGGGDEESKKAMENYYKKSMKWKIWKSSRKN